jgi:hypothetical protein
VIRYTTCVTTRERKREQYSHHEGALLESYRLPVVGHGVKEGNSTTGVAVHIRSTLKTS